MPEWMSQLAGLNRQQALNLVKQLVADGKLTPKDLENLGREFIPATPSVPSSDREIYEPEPGLASRNVWVFTSYVILLLAVAGLVAYLIASHLGR